jgi:hypothetical protein
VAYVAAADFREKNQKPWTANILLTEGDGSDAFIDLVVAQVTRQVELDLDDDFEPAVGDADETLELDGSGSVRQYIPRRVRALTSVSTRATDGVLTAQPSTLWRLHKSMNATGTVMEGSVDHLDIIATKTLLVAGSVWPYGTQTVQLVGKFGWAVVPDDIKRLVALRTYDVIRTTRDPYGRVTQKSTVDAVFTYEEIGREERMILERYGRDPVAVG